MDNEARKLNRNSFEYWKDLRPQVIAKDYGYVLNGPFAEALDEFVNELKEQEKGKRRATNGEKGILTIALGVLGEAYFKRIKPPLEKVQSVKEE